MSSILNVVTTDFRAHGGQAIATMRQMGASTRQWTGQINEATRMSDRLNNQWRAIGTTIRYAIAGQAIFGLTRMVGQLKDVQVQLGLIQAIGSQPGGGALGGLPFTTEQVTKLGVSLQEAAANSMTSITDMNNAAINFLSTVQNVRATDIPGILTQIARGAQLTQTPIEDLTQLVTTMNIAFGRPNNPKTINQNLATWFEMIKLAPGGIKAAPELVKAIPNVSTVFQQGLSPNVPAATSQAQMQALILGSLRFGATPSTAMRGLAFFLQSLETPSSKKAGEALTGIGITPRTVRSKGIYATAIGFLKHISGNLSKQQLGAIQSIPEDQLQEGMNLPGVAPDQMTFLRTSLGRIHAVRTAIVLASQLNRRGNVASLSEDLKKMLQEQDNAGTQASDMAQAWKSFNDRAKLQDMANRVNIMLLQIAQSFEGILNFFADKIVDPITKYAQGHRGVVKAGALAAGAAGATLGLAGFLRGGLFSRGIAGVAVTRSLAGMEADGTAAKPFFVIILNQIYGSGPKNIPPVVGPPGTGKTGETEAEKLGRRARAGSRIMKGARFAGWAGLALTLADLANEATGEKATGGKNLLSPEMVIAATGSRHHKHPRSFFEKWAQGVYTHEARDWIGGLFGGGGDNKKRVLGEATVNLNIKNPDGSKNRVAVHVPLEFNRNGRAPSQGGKVATGRN